MKTLKKSGLVALCGMISSLCVVLMFLTGVFPFATYAIPAITGILIVVIVVELSPGWATVTFVSVSILSLFITPDKEAAILFIFFFGHYPILKSFIERIRILILRILSKFLLFNICMISGYLVVIHVIGIADVLDEMGSFGKYSPLILLLFGNVIFWVYDLALSRLINAYISWFRPKILRRFGK